MTPTRWCGPGTGSSEMTVEQSVLLSLVAAPTVTYFAHELGPLFAVGLGLGAAYVAIELTQPGLIARVIETARIVGPIAPVIEDLERRFG